MFLSIEAFADAKKIECKFLNEGIIAQCPNAEYTNLVTIVLDTDDFSKTEANAEFSHTSCNGLLSGDVESKSFKTTSSIISIEDKDINGTSYWNIDRETLRAGWGTQRIADCEITDVDTSKNKI